MTPPDPSLQNFEVLFETEPMLHSRDQHLTMS
jgi:hypothetical protein